MSQRCSLFCLLGFFLFLAFLEIPKSWLFCPDEARYAEVPREMMASGDYLSPQLNGTQYWEKPPLLYWLNAGFMRLFGQNPYAARLTVRLSFVLTALLLCFGWRKELGKAAGLWSALVFLSAPVPFGLGRNNLTDGLLSFLLTLAFYSIWRFLCAREEGRSAVGWQWAAGLSMGLAMLTKGLIALVLPGLVYLGWVAIMKRWRRVTDLLLSWTPAVFLLVAAPWFGLMERAHPGFWHFFFVREHFERFLTNQAHRPGAPYYFVVTVVLGFLPWTFLGGQALKPLTPFRLETWRRQPLLLYLVLWIVTIVGFFSLSRSKLIPYVLPAFPPAALLVGRWLATSEVEPTRLRWVQAWFWTLLVPVGLVGGWRTGFLAQEGLRIHAVALAAFLLAGAWLGCSLKGGRRGVLARTVCWGGAYLTLILALPRLAHELSDHDLAVAAARTGAAQVVNYQTYSQSFPWLLKHPIPVVDFQGELADDGVRPPLLYWTEARFWKTWNTGKGVAVLIRKSDRARFCDPTNCPAYLVAGNRKRLLLTNFKPVEGGLSSAPIPLQ